MQIPAEITITGHAIVSSNGMIAAADGSMPQSLIVDADQESFQAALDASALVVLGRLGHERHPSKGRRRLVATRSVEALETDPAQPKIHFWNPAGIDIADVLSDLGIHSGDIAITGGQGVFDYFLGRYTSFTLAEVHNAHIEDGIACFSAGSPKQMLSESQLLPGQSITLAKNVTQTVWRVHSD